MCCCDKFLIRNIVLYPATNLKGLLFKRNTVSRAALIWPWIHLCQNWVGDLLFSILTYCYGQTHCKCLTFSFGAHYISNFRLMLDDLDISHIRSAICSLYQFDFMSNDASGSSLHPVDILRSSLKYIFKTWGLWSCVVALHILLYNLSQSTLQTCSPNADILKLSVEGVQWYYHTKVSWWHWILDMK